MILVLLTNLGIFLLLLIPLGFVSLVTYARWHYGTLEAMGIPTVKPHWLWGSNPNFTQISHHWEDLKRAKELGPVYGVYEGRTPMVYVTDPEMIYKILFTNSEHFEKREQDFGTPLVNEAIELLNGEKWKLVRNLMTPQFTTGKLKMNSHIIQSVCDEYVDFLKEKMDSEGVVSKIDVHELMAHFVVQIIAEMMCGIKLEDPRNPENKFVKGIRAALADGWMPDESFVTMLSFPFLMKLLQMMAPDGLKSFVTYLQDVMAMREKSGDPTPDMLSVLVEMRQRIKTDPEYERLSISENTVFAQAFEFFSASFLGVTGTIKHLFYYLVNNPSIYEKVREEVDASLERSGGEVTYDSVAEMKYLDACLTETSRIAPVFFRPERICVKDWHYEGNGRNINLPKGSIVVFPLYAIHHNQEIYEESEKFKPERFLPENKDKLPPCSFLTFGQGQRQCLGIRLVSQMMKIFMTKVLKQFDIRKRGDTVWEEKVGNSFFLTLSPLYVDFVKRP